jgi:hypothetical protein
MHIEEHKFIRSEIDNEGQVRSNIKHRLTVEIYYYTSS